MRPLSEIPLVEIANAVAVKDPSTPWDFDELLRATLAVFGAKRLTAGQWSRLDDARRLARRTSR